MYLGILSARLVLKYMLNECTHVLLQEMGQSGIHIIPGGSPNTVYHSEANHSHFCALSTGSRVLWTLNQPPMPRAWMMEIQYVADLSPLPDDDFPHQ